MSKQLKTIHLPHHDHIILEARIKLEERKVDYKKTWNFGIPIL